MEIWIPMDLYPFCLFISLLIQYFQLLKQAKDCYSWPKISDQLVPGPPVAGTQCNNWPIPIFLYLSLVRSLSWDLYHESSCLSQRNIAIFWISISVSELMVKVQELKLLEYRIWQVEGQTEYGQLQTYFLRN